MTDHAQPLFAREEFQRVAGETLRPGGLVLTRRGLDLWRALCPLAPATLVLDLGCGRGATARFLAAQGLCVVALDPSAELLADAAVCPAPGIAPLRGRAQALPLASACVDAVFCECVLSVTGEPDVVLGEAARVLKPGGVLVLSDLYLRGDAALADRTLRSAATQRGSGDCTSGALAKAALLGHLSGAGFRLQTFEDHSRLLAELAARLVFAGLPRAGLGGGECGGGGAGTRPGYFLCLARKLAQ